MNSIIHIQAAKEGPGIPAYLYGQFSEHLGRCIYNGLYVGEDSPIPNVNGMRTDVVEALRHIHVPLLRWPGGCFADEYHWQDGIGPKENRRRMVNTNWGGVVEDNSFGTHEFMELCRQIGCEPYINANVGSGSIQEMAEWVEYLNSPSDSTIAQKRWANGHKEPFGVRYFGVGNENWGCGGNMKPEYYADLYRRYQTYCRNYGDNKLFRIACGPSEGDWKWTETLMSKAGKYMDGLSMHYYTLPGDWTVKGSATEFTLPVFYETLRRSLKMEKLISMHLAVMDRYDPDHKVKLLVDEWGCWFDVEPGTNPGFLYQQNTMRDALVASLTLDIFNHHADRLGPCCIAQMVNVLQAMVLTEGSSMVLTPTYHVFDLYQAHMNGSLLESHVFTDTVEDMPQVHASASRKDQVITVTLSNLSADTPAETTLDLFGACAASACARVITGAPQAHNTFDAPETVKPQALSVNIADGRATVTLPPCSVAEVTLHV